MSMERKHYIFTDKQGRPVELVALIGRHVVTLCEGTPEGDLLYLNNTLVAWDKLGYDTYTCSEMFGELTGYFPFEFEGTMHPAGGECGCPCNCYFRGYER
jgi:hypothetical protein